MRHGKPRGLVRGAAVPPGEKQWIDNHKTQTKRFAMVRGAMMRRRSHGKAKGRSS